MSNSEGIIILKRSDVEGKIPDLEDLQLGELAINSFDAKLFIKQQQEAEERIVEFISQVPLEGTLFVQKGGDDDNNGLTWDRALKTVEKALELAQIRADELDNPLTLIDIGPGVYETEGHLDVPDNCMIRAAHRTVIFKPKPGFEERNVFRLGSGCFLEGPLFEDFRLDSLENPTEGFAVSFRPGAVIRRVPYAHKIAVRTTPTWRTVPPPLDRDGDPPNEFVGRGAGVCIADGAVCSPYSLFPNIMTWGATPVSHNGIGYCAKNGGLINAINAVSLWAHKHFLAIDGGQIILSACSTQFGDFTLVSEGARPIVIPVEPDENVTIEQNLVDADAIFAAKQTIVDDVWDDLSTTNNPATGAPWIDNWTGDMEKNEEFTRFDSATFIQAVVWVLQTEDITPMLNFARGLFKPDGTKVYTAEKQDAFFRSFEFMRDRMNALSTTNTVALINELVDNLIQTLTSPVTRDEPSLITAIGHTWSGTMAGVVLTNIPPARNETTIQESILEIDGGLVIASGQDDQGSALFVGGLEINADTGELSGPPFDTAVNRVATRAAIARSF